MWSQQTAASLRCSADRAAQGTLGSKASDLKVQGTECQVLETRKTVPGLRTLDKWAVLIGGGRNHRQGLYDMVMIKDNHIAAAGGIAPAVHRTQVLASIYMSC